MVIDEAFVFDTPWNRWVDEFGAPWGPLRVVSEHFVNRGLPIYAVSRRNEGARLAMRGVEYLPNIRTKEMATDLEFLDPLLSLLQSGVASTSRELSQ
ncbi:hypothetical protein V6K52_19700 [Knoellia sp. S7-12]|uniref:hypothetical protein n=1 Tax=Knoellia sp. S7-12 TaxID=3126698 RepID=UPI003365F2A7